MKRGKSVYFKTGATRSAESLFDPEGFISPGALAEYCAYMAEHRTQADGKVRDSDNWQRGMPTSRAYRSLLRHTLDAWLIHRGYAPRSPDCKTTRDALCAIVFNALLLLKNQVVDRDDHEPAPPPRRKARPVREERRIIGYTKRRAVRE
jgi:hypothetical protein